MEAIIFRPEMLKFRPYSILTGDTRVEFVIYRVLSKLIVEHEEKIMLVKDFLFYSMYVLSEEWGSFWKVVLVEFVSNQFVLSQELV